MELPEFDKFKINNTIVVFILIVDCFLFPLAITIATDFKLIFHTDAVKIIVAAAVFGCCQFAYLYCVSSVGISFLHERNWENEVLVNLIFRRSLISASVISTMGYGLMVIFLITNNGTFDNVKNLIMSGDVGLLITPIAFLTRRLYLKIKKE